MRIIQFIFIALILFNQAWQVFGSMVITPVDATNIQTMPFVVTAEPTDGGKKIVFRVIAGRKLNESKGEVMDLSFESATLSAYDGTNFVASCGVAGAKVPADMQHVPTPLAQDGVGISVHREQELSDLFQI